MLRPLLLLLPLVHRDLRATTERPLYRSEFATSLIHLLSAPKVLARYASDTIFSITPPVGRVPGDGPTQLRAVFLKLLLQ